MCWCLGFDSKCLWPEEMMRNHLRGSWDTSLPNVDLPPLRFSLWTADHVLFHPDPGGNNRSRWKILHSGPSFGSLSFFLLSSAATSSHPLQSNSHSVHSMPTGPEVLRARPLLSLDKLHWPWLFRPLRSPLCSSAERERSDKHYFPLSS